MLRYLGYYSNVCRGRRKKQGTAESEYVIEGEEYNKDCSKTWARLIKKIYEVDPLVCPIWRALHIVTLYILPKMWGQYEDNCVYRRL
ncbi:MAG: hypothetical protein KJ770_07575 [Actinobacteria bacterium]|nr:hypothetical protein [Actinomycetota bacterium]